MGLCRPPRWADKGDMTSPGGLPCRIQLNLRQGFKWFVRIPYTPGQVSEAEGHATSTTDRKMWTLSPGAPLPGSTRKEGDRERRRWKEGKKMEKYFLHMPSRLTHEPLMTQSLGDCTLHCGPQILVIFFIPVILWKYSGFQILTWVTPKALLSKPHSAEPNSKRTLKGRAQYLWEVMCSLFPLRVIYDQCIKGSDKSCHWEMYLTWSEPSSFKPDPFSV